MTRADSLSQSGVRADQGDEDRSGLRAVTSTQRGHGEHERQRRQDAVEHAGQKRRQREAALAEELGDDAARVRSRSGVTSPRTAEKSAQATKHPLRNRNARPNSQIDCPNSSSSARPTAPTTNGSTACGRYSAGIRFRPMPNRIEPIALTEPSKPMRAMPGTPRSGRSVPETRRARRCRAASASCRRRPHPRRTARPRRSAGCPAPAPNRVSPTPCQSAPHAYRHDARS
jgi:hypothetical protein